MKLAEVPRRLKADQQCADGERNNVTERSEIEVTHAHNQKVADDDVEEAPEHVNRRRGEPFAWRFCERRLKRSSHHSADKMRNGVVQEHSSEDVRHEMMPVHGYAHAI